MVMVWLATLVGFLGTDLANADDAAPSSFEMVVYNVQFLPGPAQFVNKRGENEYRAKELARQLARFDIVCLNEVFHDTHRGILLRELESQWGDRFHVVVHPKDTTERPGKFTPRFNGGLAIASQYPIVASHHCHFTVSSQPKDFGVGADGFAAKGVLHARIELGQGRQLDVFTTHLEAASQAIRLQQYPEFAQFVGEHVGQSRPLVVCGDFNTRGGPAYQADLQSDYHSLMKQLKAKTPGGQLQDLWLVLGEGPGGTSNQESQAKGNRIDYILFANTPKSPFQLEPKQVRINPYPDPKTTFLSDHSAVEAEFALR